MQEILVHAKKPDGKSHMTWTGELLKQTDDWVVVGGKLGADVHHHTRDLHFAFTHAIIGVLSRIDHYNIFIAYDDDGTFNHSYTNLATPSVLTGNEVSWTDLELDMAVDHEGLVTLLDEDEYAAAQADGAISQTLATVVNATSEQLLQDAAAARFPYNRSNHDQMASYINQLH